MRPLFLTALMVVAACVLLVLAAGCGGGGDETDENGHVPSSTQPNCAVDKSCL